MKERNKNGWDATVMCSSYCCWNLHDSASEEERKMFQNMYNYTTSLGADHAFHWTQKYNLFNVFLLGQVLVSNTTQSAVFQIQHAVNGILDWSQEQWFGVGVSVCWFLFVCLVFS